MKRCMSICCVLTMAFGLSLGVSTDTQAASSVKVIDESKLTRDAESTGYNQKIARGEDLLTGYSKIVRMGPGELYAGLNVRRKKIQNGAFMILGINS